MPELTGDRLESLFAQVADLPLAERARFFDELSLSEPALARELASLLEHDRTARQRLHDIMDRAVADASSFPLWSGQAFGSYRVVRTIATGGMEPFSKRFASRITTSGWH